MLWLIWKSGIGSTWLVMTHDSWGWGRSNVNTIHLLCSLVGLDSFHVIIVDMFSVMSRVSVHLVLPRSISSPWVHNELLMQDSPKDSIIQATLIPQRVEKWDERQCTKVRAGVRLSFQIAFRKVVRYEWQVMQMVGYPPMMPKYMAITTSYWSRRVLFLHAGWYQQLSVLSQYSRSFSLSQRFTKGFPTRHDTTQHDTTRVWNGRFSCAAVFLEWQGWMGVNYVNILIHM